MLHGAHHKNKTMIKFSALFLVFAELFADCANLEVFGESEITFKDVAFQVTFFNKSTLEVKIDSSVTLEDHVPDQSSVRKINFFHQSIPVLYKGSIRNLDKLRILELANNAIFEIRPGAFENLPELNELNVSHNYLEHLSSGVFNNLHLYNLDLSNNNIKTVEKAAFDDIPTLLMLKMDFNHITKIDSDWFSNTNKIIHLSIQYNEIEHIPEGAFRNIRGTNSSRPYIFLNNNKIKSIDRNAFKNTTSLNSLYLEHNELNYLEKDTFKHLQLDNLWLSFNKFTCMDDYETNLIAKVTNIAHNPWDCECLKKIVKWSKTTNRMFILPLLC